MSNIVIPDGGNIGSASDTDAISISSSGAVTLSSDFVPATPLSNRNMIINGAMRVAQRGTSSTVNDYGTVDRFRSNLGNNDENATQSQHVLTSSDTGPYEEGFRRSFRITNGNQTNGAGTSDTSGMLYRMESQDIANSGWNYLSSSSYITLSFWCKSSVAQNFYGRLTSQYGTQQNYPFETGSLSANTWAKITKSIPGNSNLQFDNTNGLGLDIEFTTFRGTDLTGSVSLNTWAAYNASTRVPDMTSTWYTTDDATWEITGVQLERGQVATPFEHRTFADELLRCQRYYQNSYRLGETPATSTPNHADGQYFTRWDDGNVTGPRWTVAMRAAPSVTIRGYGSNTTGQVKVNGGSFVTNSSAQAINHQSSAYINIPDSTAGVWAHYTWEAFSEL